MTTNKKMLLNAISVAAALALLAFTLYPLLSEAALFAYVSTNGSIMTVAADTPTDAITIAPEREARSGVLMVPDPTTAMTLLPAESSASVAGASTAAPVSSYVAPDTTATTSTSSISIDAVGDPVATGTSTGTTDDSMGDNTATDTTPSTDLDDAY